MVTCRLLHCIIGRDDGKAHLQQLLRQGFVKAFYVSTDGRRTESDRTFFSHFLFKCIFIINFAFGKSNSQDKPNILRIGPKHTIKT